MAARAPPGANGMVFPTAENKNFEQHFLTCRGPSWSGLIRGSMREWCRGERGERRKERRRKSYQTVVLCLSQKCNMIYSGICKSNNHSALFTEGTCWFRVWKGEREGERNNPNYKSQPTVHTPRQTPATKSAVFLRIRKWRVLDKSSVVSQLQISLNLFWWRQMFDVRTEGLYAIYVS